MGIDGEEDYSLSVDDAKDGRPVFQLEFESARDADVECKDDEIVLEHG